MKSTIRSAVEAADRAINPQHVANTAWNYAASFILVMKYYGIIK